MYEKGDDDGNWTESFRNNFDCIYNFITLFAYKIFDNINFKNNCGASYNPNINWFLKLGGEAPRDIKMVIFMPKAYFYSGWEKIRNNLFLK